MTEPHCLVEQEGHTLVVTMNRPEAKNALSGEMMDIMREAWDRVNTDDSIRVAILTGANGAFCAGADLKAMTASHPGDSFEGGGWDLSVIKPLLKGFRLSKPLIAAVEGPAIAGGTEILQATDIRVAGESAKFGVSEPRWGLYPLGGSAVRLTRQIPYTVAADLLLTGRHITAREAFEIQAQPVEGSHCRHCDEAPDNAPEHLVRRIALRSHAFHRIDSSGPAHRRRRQDRRQPDAGQPVALHRGGGASGVGVRRRGLRHDPGLARRPAGPDRSAAL